MCESPQVGGSLAALEKLAGVFGRREAQRRQPLLKPLVECRPLRGIHLEIHPPCSEPPSNLIQVNGFLQENRDSDKEDLSGVVEVLPDDNNPNRYILYYGGAPETVDAPLSGQILGRILDALMQ